jgi:coproporphyrinogen III oxidase
MSNITKEEISLKLQELQKSICSALEASDGVSKFNFEKWEHLHGGGGITSIIQKGGVIEKGGVNYSGVSGNVPPFLISEDEHSITKEATSHNTFYATGVSIVIHPLNPWVPIIHMNVRYFEMDNGVWWFGGGIDLTPHYVIDEDVAFFHENLKAVCDKYSVDFYPKFKSWADDYFFIQHRNETRGVGGIFFDRLTKSQYFDKDKLFNFILDVGNTFAPVYTELMRRNYLKEYNEDHKKWQLIRRGRYVEFNLVYDKGTQFGLQTNGRIESILMSLPEHASWIYNHIPAEASIEAETLKKLKKGIQWV